MDEEAFGAGSWGARTPRPEEPRRDPRERAGGVPEGRGSLEQLQPCRETQPPALAGSEPGCKPISLIPSSSLKGLPMGKHGEKQESKGPLEVAPGGGRGEGALEGPTENSTQPNPVPHLEQ